MIRIRHSFKPYQELEIGASASEFAKLRSAILDFCEALEPTVEVPVQSEFDPTPGQRKLVHLCLCRTEDPLLISVADGKLFISGKSKFLRLFAENLPCQPRSACAAADRVHFGRVEGDERISEASVEIVLTLE